VFGALLGIRQQFRCQRGIFFRRGTATARAGNRTHRNHVALKASEDFR